MRRDLRQASLDPIPVGADLDTLAQFLLGVADDLREIPVDEGLPAEQGDFLRAVLVSHQGEEASGFVGGEGVRVLKPLAVEAVQAREVAAVEQLQVQHPDLPDPGDFPDHLGSFGWLPIGNPIVAVCPGTSSPRSGTARGRPGTFSVTRERLQDA